MKTVLAELEAINERVIELMRLVCDHAVPNPTATALSNVAKKRVQEATEVARKPRVVPTTTTSVAAPVTQVTPPVPPPVAQAPPPTDPKEAWKRAKARLSSVVSPETFKELISRRPLPPNDVVTPEYLSGLIKWCNQKADELGSPLSKEPPKSGS